MELIGFYKSRAHENSQKMTKNSTTQRIITNNLDLQHAVQQVVSTYRAARPANTIKNYENKQVEFEKWCSTRGFVDGSVVTEGKILLYLNEVVAPRGSGKIQDGVVLPLSAEGLQGYVKPLIDLYNTQQSLGMNNNPHPRGDAVRGYLQSHQRQRAKRKRAEYHDRGEGTVNDTYNSDEHKKMARYFMGEADGRGLRDRLDYLLGHALIARGETTRKLQLPDLFTKEMKNEGPTTCLAVMAIMDQGKVNQFGRIDYGGCIRHRDVEVCPVGALAMYLFWRYHVVGEVFPRTADRKTWYNTHLIDGKDASIEIHYATQYDGMKRAMRACGVVSKKVSSCFACPIIAWFSIPSYNMVYQPML